MLVSRTVSIMLCRSPQQAQAQAVRCTDGFSEHSVYEHVLNALINDRITSNTSYAHLMHLKGHYLHSKAALYMQ